MMISSEEGKFLNELIQYKFYLFISRTSCMFIKKLQCV